MAAVTATIALWFASDDVAMIAQLVIVLAKSKKTFLMQRHAKQLVMEARDEKEGDFLVTFQALIKLPYKSTFGKTDDNTGNELMKN